MEDAIKTLGRYIVPQCNVQPLLDRIADLNKRAAKLGVAPVAVRTELDHVRVLVKNHYHGTTQWVAEADLDFTETGYVRTGAAREWWLVEVDGVAPCYNGWTFAATLEPVEVEGGQWVNLMLTVPGQHCPTEYKEAKAVGRCDHCKASRRRKQTFVVRHTDGTTKAVGRQCLKDFLGHTDPHSLATWAELLASLDGTAQAAEDEGYFGGGGLEDGWDTATFLAWTAGAIRCWGWCSRGKAKLDEKLVATADRVIYLLAPPRFTGPNAGRDRAEWKQAVADATPTDQDKADAQAALDWVRGLDEKALEEDYLANINICGRAPVTLRKTAGLAASIVAAWAKAVAKQIEEAKLAKRKGASQWVGTKGKRQEFTVTVDRVITTEGLYGLTGIHKLEDQDGNSLVWFASGSATWLEVGRTYTIKATPKAHEEYKGWKQTVVSRVAVQQEHAPGCACCTQAAVA